MTTMSLAHKVSAYNRRRKWSLFQKEFAPTREMRVLDVGFCDGEYSDVSNYIEKYYPYPDRLTALGLGMPVQSKIRYPKVSFVQYDGGVFPFEDKAFDIAWSNAVIEHVGPRDKQLFFLKELKRVSKSVFMTTPNRFFPIEVHTKLPLLHYLPKRIFDKLIPWIGKGWAAGDYMHLLSRTDIKHLLADAGVTEYRIIKNMFGGMALDFVVIFGEHRGHI